MITKALNFHVHCPDEAEYLLIKNALTRYRDACNKLLGHLVCDTVFNETLAYASNGAAFLAIKNQSEFRRAAYAYRDQLKELLHGLKSELADAVLAEVYTALFTKLPEYNGLSRIKAITQGKAELPLFTRTGLGLRARSTSGKPGGFKVTGHDFRFSLVPKKFITLKINKLDGVRWRTLQKIISGEYKAGDYSLNFDRKGRLRISLPYSCEEAAPVASGKTLQISYNAENSAAFLQLDVQEENKARRNYRKCRVYSAETALADLERNRILQLKKISHERNLSFAPRQLAGVRRQREKITRRREGICKAHNHQWTRAIVNQACSRACGDIMIYDLPQRELFGFAWPWFQFKSFLAYKAKEVGIKVSYKKSPSVAKLSAVLTN